VEQSRINFEDELHNAVYVKKKEISESRKKRDAYNDHFPKEDDSDKYNKVEIKNVTDNATKMYISFSIEVSGTEFYLTKLHHFTQYEVNVQACREKSKEREDTSSPCSNTSSKFHRTMQKKGADDIKHVQVTNQSLEMVSITWKEPEDPNGVILCYTIEYKKLDNENSKANQESVTHTRFLNQSRIHTLKGLSPGNYSLRVFATSSAEHADFSPYVYFYIEERSSSTPVVWVAISVGLLIVCRVLTVGCVV
jgi:insulin receptor